MAVEEADGHLQFASGFTFLQALLTALGKPVLNCAGVVGFVAWDAGDCQELLFQDETAVMSSGNRCTVTICTTLSRHGRQAKIC